MALLLFGGTLFILLKIYGFEENRYTNKEQTKKTVEILRPGTDPKRHLKYAKNAVIKETLKLNERIIYKAYYRYNQYYLRTPTLKNSVKASEHLIFAGCSFTFGDGLEDKDVFPWMIEDKYKELNVYNLSQSGASVSNMLSYLDTIDLKSFVKEKSGRMAYIYIHDQLPRWAGRPGYLLWAWPNFAHYEVKKNQVIYKGYLKDQPFYKIFSFFKSVGLEKFYASAFGAFYREEWSQEEIEDFVLAVQVLKEKYLKIFPQGRFSFIVHPHFPGPINILEKIKLALNRQKIEYLNAGPDFYLYYKSRGQTHQHYGIEANGHPNEKSHQYLFHWLEKNYLKKDLHPGPLLHKE